MTVLGAKPETLQEQESSIRDSTGQPVKLKPFTSDRSVIEAEIRGADLMIMASKHDGFGLTATEAAGVGLPVLVPSNIGVGMFFSDPNRVPPELGLPSVIQVPPIADQAPVELWAERAEALIKDMPETRSRALQLREHLGKGYTWGHTAANLENHLAQIEPRVDRDRSAEAVVAIATTGLPAPSKGANRGKENNSPSNPPTKPPHGAKQNTRSRGSGPER